MSFRHIHRTRGARSDRLDPVRWSPRRRARLLRAGLVAALLVLSAGVLLSGTRPAAADRCAGTSTHRHRPSAGPSPTHVGVPAGHVGVPVRVDQPGVAAVLHTGDRVDLAVASADDTDATIVVRDALVLRATGDSSGAGVGSVVYLSLTERQARRVTAIGPDSRVSVTVRPGAALPDQH